MEEQDTQPLGIEDQEAVAEPSDKDGTEEARDDVQEDVAGNESAQAPAPAADFAQQELADPNESNPPAVECTEIEATDEAAADEHESAAANQAFNDASEREHAAAAEHAEAGADAKGNVEGGDAQEPASTEVADVEAAGTSKAVDHVEAVQAVQDAPACQQEDTSCSSSQPKEVMQVELQPVDIPTLGDGNGGEVAETLEGVTDPETKLEAKEEKGGEHAQEQQLVPVLVSAEGKEIAESGENKRKRDEEEDVVIVGEDVLVSKREKLAEEDEEDEKHEEEVAEDEEEEEEEAEPPAGEVGEALRVASAKKGSHTLTMKDVRRMMSSPMLLKPNAVAHTMRKLIVFASLAIRNGLDDLMKLEVSHFKVLNRGAPYVSQQLPGEHVLFDPPPTVAPDLVQKQFFPNPHNPFLCPVRIIDEEDKMRPANSPPSLFLTVKYAKAPSYEPLNRYVRNAMGRATLARFSTHLADSAGLKHVGRRFFRSLGITIMFMAGFTLDEVLREAKCSLTTLNSLYRAETEEEKRQREALASNSNNQLLADSQGQPVLKAKGLTQSQSLPRYHMGKGQQVGGSPNAPLLYVDSTKTLGGANAPLRLPTGISSNGQVIGQDQQGQRSDSGSGGPVTESDIIASQLRSAQILQQLQATQLLSAQLQAQLLSSQLQTAQLQAAMQSGGKMPAGGTQVSSMDSQSGSVQAGGNAMNTQMLTIPGFGSVTLPGLNVGQGGMDSNAGMNVFGGAQGLQALQGIQGIQGLQGLQGIQGLQGLQGLQGIHGIQGIQGVISSMQNIGGINLTGMGGGQGMGLVMPQGQAGGSQGQGNLATQPNITLTPQNFGAGMNTQMTTGSVQGSVGGLGQQGQGHYSGGGSGARTQGGVQSGSSPGYLGVK